MEERLLQAIWTALDIAPPADAEWERVMDADDRLLGDGAKPSSKRPGWPTPCPGPAASPLAPTDGNPLSGRDGSASSRHRAPRLSPRLRRRRRPHRRPDCYTPRARPRLRRPTCRGTFVVAHPLLPPGFRIKTPAVRTTARTSGDPTGTSRSWRPAGITPLLSIPQQYLAAGTGHAHVVFGERTESSIIHRGTLNELADNDSLDVAFTLSDPNWE